MAILDPMLRQRFVQDRNRQRYYQHLQPVAVYEKAASGQNHLSGDMRFVLLILD